MPAGLSVLFLGCLLLPQLAMAIDLAQQPLVRRSWTLGSAVQAIAQDAGGRILIGTRGGLMRFNGATFVDLDRVEGKAPQAPGRPVRHVIAAADSLWVATGETFFDHGRPWPRAAVPYHIVDGELRRGGPLGRDFQRVEGLASGWVWALARDGDAGVWIGTDTGLVRMNGAGREVIDLRPALSSNLVTALAASDDALFIGTTAGVAIRRKGQITATAIKDSIIALAADRSGQLWAVARGRLYRLHNHGLQVIDAEAYVVAIDAERQAWLGTTKGLMAFRPDGTPAPLAAPSRLTDAHVTSLTFDWEGSLWAGTQDGELHHLSVPRVRNLGSNEGLNGDLAFALLRTRDGAMMVSAFGGLSRFAGNAVSGWRLQDELPAYEVRSLSEGLPGAPNAGLWIAAGQTLLRGQGGQFEKAPAPFTTGGRVAHSVIAARSGDLWVSWAQGGLTLYPQADFSRPIDYRPADGVCGEELAYGFEANDGSLWFANVYRSGRAPGVTQISNRRARCYQREDGLPDLRIGAIAEEVTDGESSMWLGAQAGGGLVRLRQGRFSVVSADHGLPATSVTGLLDDGRGNLWIGSQAGVWRVAKKNLHRCADGPCDDVHATVFGKDEGMRGPECLSAFHPNLVVDAAGGVWAATMRGVSVFPAGGPHPLIVPIIEQATVDRRPLPPLDPVELGPASSELVIRYSASTFLSAGPPRLLHRLRGYETRWNHTTSPTEAHYRDLPPGRYDFQVRAVEDESAMATLAVIVAPPFWRTSSFFALALLAVAGMALALHRLRLARVQLQHRLVNEERVRIARELHDGLAQKFTAIGMLIARAHTDAPRPSDQPSRGRGLERAQQVLREAHGELRRAVWDMREWAGRETRLEILLERVLAQVIVPASIDLVLETGDSSIPVNALVAHEVPHIVREAVTNALRHAECRRIEIGMVSDLDGIYVWIRDDGVGLSGRKRVSEGAGYGIIGMHERSRRIGGELDISSTPGRGTEVRLLVPLSPTVRPS